MSALEKQKKALAGLLSAALDTLLPPRCLATGEIVEADGLVSANVWPQLQFIEAPFCRLCGLPFSFAVAGDSLCAPCLEYPPVFDAARAPVVYNDISRQMILSFKYGDRLHAVKTFAPWMRRAGAELIAAADILVPVPLSGRRLRERRFNQSALLAQEIARGTGKGYSPDLLLRTRHTPPQQGLNYKERSLNVRGAFALNEKRKAALSGMHVLLVDDVYTSGATLNECARVLKKSGSASVSVLTIARVTKDE